MFVLLLPPPAQLLSLSLSKKYKDMWISQRGWTHNFRCSRESSHPPLGQQGTEQVFSCRLLESASFRMKCKAARLHEELQPQTIGQRSQVLGREGSSWGFFTQMERNIHKTPPPHQKKIQFISAHVVHLLAFLSKESQCLLQSVNKIVRVFNRRRNM